MKYVVALDSFKECLTSSEANEAVKEGLLDACPGAEVADVTVSDGGEGFLDAMRPDERVSCPAHDAMMRPVVAEYGLTDDGGKGPVAVIETARVVGLGMIEPELRNPLRATSYGLGEVMADARRRGCRRFVVGLGGSAVSDCGLGMLRALKHALLAGRGLSDGAPFDTSVLAALDVTLATDVASPLLGPEGAARMFGPQKGATPEAVELLERRAATFAEAAARHQGRDCRQAAGAGAAGGLGYAFMEFMRAAVVPGAELVLRRAGFDGLLEGCRLVVTGEGHADRQTLLGKLPAVVMDRARRRGVSTALLAGRVDDAAALKARGFARVEDINAGQPAGTDALLPDVARSRLRAAARRLAEATCRDVLSGPAGPATGMPDTAADRARD